MSSPKSQWIDFDPQLMEGSGVVSFAIAETHPVDEPAQQLYNNWISAGHHGEMAYLERYEAVRANPAELLPGAQSIVCCAFPYYYPREKKQQPSLSIARYALGRDYHDIVRSRLEIVARAIRETYGGETRVCVDTAPLRERYWAMRAGLGFIGRNNHLIVPGVGSYTFLGEILTTAPLRPTGSHNEIPANPCQGCYRCVRACPTQALATNGSCDARRCLSYLTIEYRGDFAPDTNLHGSFYGCDRCAAACPYNRTPARSTIEEFRPNPAIEQLTANDIASMTQETFSTTFRGSAMKRAKLAGLQRNILALIRQNRSENGNSLNKN